LVDDVFDLDPHSVPIAKYGAPHPATRASCPKLVLYYYLSRVRSSRKIEKSYNDSVAFGFLSTNAASDRCSITRLRRCQLEALCGLLVEILKLRRAAGTVLLGRVAPDSIKSWANDSRH
jgi:hypothetical protein